jgi:hypothetical protein
MGKRKMWFLILFGVLLIVLAIMNMRYPFLVANGGHWSVGYQETSSPLNFLVEPKGILSSQVFDTLTKPEIAYIADPFFIKEKDIFYLFTEIKGKQNADIALFTSSTGKDYSYQGIVLDESFHLSYPQVFKYKNEFYMLPETKGANQLLLYKAKDFPYTWIVSDTLIKNRALKDPSLLLSEDLNLIVAVDDDLKQYLFTADSLEGNWKAVKTFNRRWGNESRPGGRFISIEGKWYLPLQNHSNGYGTGISLYQLNKVEDIFKFELVVDHLLGPQQDILWFGRGMHHLDVQQLSSGSYYVVYDGDRKGEGNPQLQLKRSIKWNLVDLYNYLEPNIL